MHRIMASEIIVDARGHHCPVPTLRLRRALEDAPAGAQVRLYADDPMARIDVPHFASGAGFEVVVPPLNWRRLPGTMPFV